ncbi:hypothetical protein GCK72_022839 [Caenorhabditis remanei]|uniref:Uncharacterized protein n=1 Tax=Caenorhabditis remanei TaxID=31234 RepID=A0A6A5FV56_CAERE|nr:hypothetical protein GCK72_022839 [Caenorhabditis remanei]KAF1746385.1 hypothetical protein GCK72_022839 [Caenorhabditis remanei]
MYLIFSWFAAGKSVSNKRCKDMISNSTSVSSIHAEDLINFFNELPDEPYFEDKDDKRTPEEGAKEIYKQRETWKEEIAKRVAERQAEIDMTKNAAAVNRNTIKLEKIDCSFFHIKKVPMDYNEYSMTHVSYSVLLSPPPPRLIPKRFPHPYN